MASPKSTAEQRPSILEMPEEVLQKVATFLDHRSLFDLGLTSRRLLPIADRVNASRCKTLLVVPVSAKFDEIVAVTTRFRQCRSVVLRCSDGPCADNRCEHRLSKHAASRLLRAVSVGLIRCEFLSVRCSHFAGKGFPVQRLGRFLPSLQVLVVDSSWVDDRLLLKALAILPQLTDLALPNTYALTGIWLTKLPPSLRTIYWTVTCTVDPWLKRFSPARMEPESANATLLNRLHWDAPAPFDTRHLAPLLQSKFTALTTLELVTEELVGGIKSLNIPSLRRLFLKVRERIAFPTGFSEIKRGTSAVEDFSLKLCYQPSDEDLDTILSNFPMAKRFLLNTTEFALSPASASALAVRFPRLQFFGHRDRFWHSLKHRTNSKMEPTVISILRTLATPTHFFVDNFLVMPSEVKWDIVAMLVSVALERPDRHFSYRILPQTHVPECVPPNVLLLEPESTQQF